MLSTGLFISCWLVIRDAERSFRGRSLAGLRMQSGLPLAAPVTLPMVSRVFQIGESRVLRVDDDFPAPECAGFRSGIVLVVLALPARACCEPQLGASPRTARRAWSSASSEAAIWRVSPASCSWARRTTPLRRRGSAVWPSRPRFRPASLVSFCCGARPARDAALAVALAVVWCRWSRSSPAAAARRHGGRRCLIRANTPAESVIVSDETDKKWVAYLAAREVDEIPRPVSELVTARVRGKRRLAKLLRSGPLTPDRFEEPGGPALLTRPLFFVREAKLEKSYLKLVFSSDRRYVYRYDPS
jgi:hypothetical protein